ncbi:hypothetical protein A8C32_18595 [Flavivirga aquatica]|uniref:HTH luxR-type domain-containing protein n=1 Tax=Flavivirga aquatica TaxID=1849968 RepID=A0A1E5T3T3_9FLAO|nr:hypothetical protein [Flavivirga aquatica]OEK06045.1 hypothetical protein A8C32_18595 [Flavivirga aquatica]
MTFSKDNIRHYLKNILIFYLCIFYSLIVYSQIDEQYRNKEMSKLLDHAINDTSLIAYKNYLEALNISKKTGAKEFELLSYRKLMNYYGYKKNLDSMLNYAYKFENENYQGQNIKLVHNFFFQKGYNLVYNFEMIEESSEAYEKAYKYIEKEDINTTIKTITGLAYNYITKRQYDKAIETLSFIQKDSISDVEHKFYFLTTLASAYQCKEIPEKSYPINLELLELTKKQRDSSNIYFVKTNIVFDYFLKGEFQKAIDSGTEITASLKKFSPDMLYTNFYNLSRAYDAIGDTNKAIYYMNKSITSQSSDKIGSHNIIEGLDFLITFYEKKKNYKKAFINFRKRSRIIDSIRAKEQKIFVDYYDTKTKIIDQVKEKEKIQAQQKVLILENNKQRQYIVFLAICGICVIFIFTSLWIYYKYFKSKKKIVALQNNEREILKNHIDIRENELSVLVVSKAKAISKLAKIKDELSKAIKENSLDKFDGIEKKLSSFLLNFGNDPLISERLESQYPGMILGLKKLHPELSDNDIKHCILVKLNLSLKESAQLLHVGIGAVKMGRNRAKTKMNIPNETSLKNYLDQI